MMTNKDFNNVFNTLTYRVQTLADTVNYNIDDNVIWLLIHRLSLQLEDAKEDNIGNAIQWAYIFQQLGKLEATILAMTV